MSCAVTVGQIVDDDLNDLATSSSLGSGQVVVEIGNLLNSIEPNESRNLRNVQSLILGVSVGDLSSGGLNLSGVRRAEEDVAVREGVARWLSRAGGTTSRST